MLYYSCFRFWHQQLLYVEMRLQPFNLFQQYLQRVAIIYTKTAEYISIYL